MIDTDDLDNMRRRDLVELLEAYNESLAEVKRLREAIAFATDTDKYEGHTPAPWEATNDGIIGMRGEMDVGLHLFDGCYNEADAQLVADAPLILAENKRLQEENKKQSDVLSTLDEMIRKESNHVELMKALEQGLDLPNTWQEMIE